MTIDPNIIAGLRTAPPVALPDPMEQYSKSLALKGLMNQSAQQERAVQRQDALQKLLASNPNEQGLMQAGFLDESLKVGKDGREMAKGDADLRETKAKADKLELERHLQMAQHVGAVYNTARDQPSWDAARRQLHMIDPEAASKTPEQFDPAFIQAKVAFGQTVTQQLADERAKLSQVEVGRHNLSGEANAAGQLQVARGNLGTARERLAMEAGQPKDTYVGAKENPLTEAQGRGQMFGTRAAESDKILQGIEEKISATGLAAKEGASNLPLIGGLVGALGNAAISKDQQKVEQAQRNFVNAVLRQESGAVINPQEFENAKKQYFVQPGDSKEVIEQKRQNRQSAIEGFRVMAGSAGSRIEEARQQPNATVAVKKPKLGERQGGYLFKGGDPANPASWEKV